MLMRGAFTLEQALAAVTVAVGGAVFAGWIFGLPDLKSVLPGAVEMKANTAAGLIMVGGGLWAFGSPGLPYRLILVRLTAAAVGLLGLSTSAQYLLGLNFGIDELLFKDTGRAYNDVPGRMSPVSAVAFVILAVALAALPHPQLRLVTRISSALVAMAGAISLVGYFWNAGEIITDIIVPPVAINTAVAFFAAGTGIYVAASRTEASSRGGRAAAKNIVSKLLIGFVAISLVLVVGGRKLYSSIADYSEMENGVLHSYSVLKVATELYAAIANAERVQRDYALIGRTSDKDEFERYLSEAYNLGQQLGSLVESYAGHGRSYDELRSAIASNLKSLRFVTDALDSNTIPAVEEAIALAAASVRIDDVHLSVKTIVETESRILTERNEELDRQRKNLSLLLLVMLGSVVGIFVFLFIYIHRVVDRLEARDARIVDLNATLEVEIQERSAALAALAQKERERQRFIEELEEARHEAERASDTKSGFLATMSHEIRTPMNGVVAMVDLLGETKLDDDQHSMVGTIKSSAYSLLGIIGDILDFSKLDSGHLTIESIPVSMAEIMESSVAIQWSEAAKKSLAMPMFCDPRLPARIFSDPIRLRQIFVNLISNAVKFTQTTPERPGKIIIRADLIGESQNRLQVRLSVGDNGLGMDDDMKSRLFRPFEQADASTVRRFGGTGLGLSIVKQLVDLMGGAISLESSPGNGSRFSIDVWVDAEPAAKPSTDLAGLRVLILGSADTPEPPDFLARYLAHHGGTAAISYQTDACLDRLRDAIGGPDKFDILVIAGRSLTNEARIAVRDAALSIPGAETLRVIFLNFDYQNLSFIQDAQSLTIPATPMSRDTFIKAVAIVSGRASPDTQLLAMPKTLPKLIAPSIDDAERMGQLILVAEDNETNRDVFRRQVEILGYAAIIVGNGAEALDVLASRRIALLLTDCHMPVMDGYQLTETIRAAESGAGRRLPIIAVTANALRGEAERCLKIGMDDFIVKPIELAEFRVKLSKWIPRAPAAARIAEPAEPEDGDSSQAASPTFDRKRLEYYVGDEPEIVNEVLGQFAAPARRIADDIGAAFAARDAAPIAFGAHKLKSSAKMIGAETLAEICEILEEAAKKADWMELDAVAPRLDETLAAVIESIERELDTADAV